MCSFDRHRKRRVIYNDDADQQYVGYEGYDYRISDEQSFIAARTTPTFDSHVDTYVWCVGNGSDPPWGGRQTLRPCLRSHAHATDLIVEACHSHGLEVWGSLRINDIHDSFMADSLERSNDPLKAEHPEYLLAPESSRHLPAPLAERYLWTAFNLARAEVRLYRLSFVEQNASAHDFDGYELDFTRFVWNFPLGQERAHAHEMTDLVRQARSRLNAIGQRRGRPYTFAVHVVDSPELSLELGLDVVAWLKEGLVDVLVVGMGYLPYALRLEEWLALGKQYRVAVYPSMNTNTYITWYKEKLRRLSAWHEAIRASSAYFWQEGADGLYIFNLFCQEDKNVGPMPRQMVYAPLREIGEPAALVGRDKLYSIQPASESGFCHHGSAATPLPVPLDRFERKLPLKVGPDPDQPDARFRLSLWTAGSTEQGRLWVRLNHTLLPQPARQGDWYHLDLPSGILRKGSNELSVWSDADLAASRTPVVLHQVFLSARYGERKGGEP